VVLDAIVDKLEKVADVVIDVVIGVVVDGNVEEFDGMSVEGNVDKDVDVNRGCRCRR